MKYVGYVFSIIIIFFGVIFLWSAFGPYSVNPFTRLFGGIGTIVVGVVVLVLTARWAKKKQQAESGKVEITHKVDLTGDLHLEQLNCASCGAPLDKKSVSVQAGAVHVSCPYCGTTYTVEEEPKW